jgi:hypothetical protein
MEELFKQLLGDAPDRADSGKTGHGGQDVHEGSSVDWVKIDPYRHSKS